MNGDRSAESPRVEEIQAFITFAREQAYVSEGVDYSPCYQREENAAFLAEYDIDELDIRNCIADLRLQQFSHISKEVGKTDAYVFGVELSQVDETIYMKLKRKEGVLVVSFHLPHWDMPFPFRDKEV